jgi:hypothetical protein
MVTAATVTSLQIAPYNTRIADPIVPKGIEGRYIAIAHYSDGDSVYVTTQSTWISSNENAVEIVANGEDAGRAQAIEVGASDINAFYGEVTSNTSTVTVTDAVLITLQVLPVNESIAAGNRLQYQAIGTFSDGSHETMTDEVTWISEPTSIATIDETGKAEGVSSGQATIEAVYPTSSGTPISGETTLNVTAATIDSIVITPVNITVPKGTTGNFTATAYYSDLTSDNVTKDVVWSSSDNDVISILTGTEDAGKAYALDIGQAVVSASLGDIISNEAAVEVTAAELVDVEIIAPDTSIPKGSRSYFEAFANFSDGSTEDITQDADWQSEDSSIAVVVIGEVKGVNQGSTDITINYLAESDSQAIIVTDPILEEVIIRPSFAAISVDAHREYIATAHYSDGSINNVTEDLFWLSEDDSVAVFDGATAVAKGLSAGNVEILAEFDGVQVGNVVILEVFEVVLDEIIITPLDELISLNSYVQYTAVGHYSNEEYVDITNDVTWDSSNPLIATIETLDEYNGLAHGVAEGSTNIRASLDGLSSSTTLTVSDSCGPNNEIESIFISPSDATISVGSTFQFHLFGLWPDGCVQELTYNNAANWDSTDPDIVTIGKKDGLATGHANGSAVIEARYQQFQDPPATAGIDVIGEEVLSVSIQPAPDVTISKNSSQNYVCSAITAINGEPQPEQSVTAEATFTSSDKKIATIGTNDGTNQSVDAKNKDGHTTITCSYGGQSSSSSLNVD